MTEKKELFGPEEIGRAIERMTEAIVRDFAASDGNFALIGLHTQGVPLACRLANAIELRTGRRPQLGTLDISMYRDDVGQRSALPLIRETEIYFSVDDAQVILVDDVLSTGRTIRAALDALTDYGRPALIRLAVLVDRGNPEYPIRADYTGLRADSCGNKKILVEFTDTDGADRISAVDWKRQ